eukprot:CAMPEP_0198554104 /NCGR_PEP_ID=MMETSP1462-20131121/81818_1 /TAXON_ID=1333877 /ORGANISM="Brandtodinium nutriculum, Strain RCC3387" /LENGTH=67 /DNA_ID=CAMNT_0044284799 /DNA_START=78 /DNA_END=278 /DNA_ORIENTATION=-
MEMVVDAVGANLEALQLDLRQAVETPRFLKWKKFQAPLRKSQGYLDRVWGAINHLRDTQGDSIDWHN